MAKPHVGPGVPLANSLTRADKKALTSFSLATALIIAFPFALSAYAYAGSWAEVRDCYNVGVRVAHSVTPLQTEGR